MSGVTKGSKVNRKGRNTDEQYIKLSYRMLRSDAWRSLGGPAVKVYFELRTRYMGANNGGLKGEKQEMSEGGIRVPAGAAWPGKIAPGTTSDLITLTMDLYPTIAEAAGSSASRGKGT